MAGSPYELRATTPVGTPPLRVEMSVGGTTAVVDATPRGAAVPEVEPFYIVTAQLVADEGLSSLTYSARACRPAVRMGTTEFGPAATFGVTAAGGGGGGSTLSDGVAPASNPALRLQVIFGPASECYPHKNKVLRGMDAYGSCPLGLARSSQWPSPAGPTARRYRVVRFGGRALDDD